MLHSEFLASLDFFATNCGFRNVFTYSRSTRQAEEAAELERAEGAEEGKGKKREGVKRSVQDWPLSAQRHVQFCSAACRPVCCIQTQRGADLPIPHTSGFSLYIRRAKTCLTKNKCLMMAFFQSKVNVAPPQSSRVTRSMKQSQQEPQRVSPPLLIPRIFSHPPVIHKVKSKTYFIGLLLKMFLQPLATQHQNTRANKGKSGASSLFQQVHLQVKRGMH